MSIPCYAVYAIGYAERSIVVDTGFSAAPGLEGSAVRLDIER